MNRALPTTLTFFLLVATACRSDSSTADDPKPSAISAKSGAVAQNPEGACDLSLWRKSGLIVTFPKWCEGAENDEAKRASQMLIEKSGWALNEEGSGLSAEGAASMGCGDLEQMLDVAGSCLARRPRPVTEPLEPSCKEGWLVYAPYDEQWDNLACTDGTAWCRAQTECIEAGRCEPASDSEDVLRCTASPDSCQYMATCRDFGCEFDEAQSRCTRSDCGFLAHTLSKGPGLEGLLDELDPDRSTTLPELLEQAAAAFERCEKSPHWIERVPPAPGESYDGQPVELVALPDDAPISGALFRIRCVSEDGKKPCADGFDPWKQYTALAWSIGDARGVVPLFGTSTDAMQREINLKSATLRELEPNAFGWTHELEWTVRHTRSNWGSAESGATCCEYGTFHTETLHAMIRVDDDVKLGAVYISRSEHDAYESYEGGETIQTPAGVDCRASLEWADDGAARFMVKRRGAGRVVTVRPAPDGDRFAVTRVFGEVESQRIEPSLADLESLGCYTARH